MNNAPATTSAKLTDTFLRGLTGAHAGVYRDLVETTLACRVSPRGRKVWLADTHVQGRHVRKTLGLFQGAPGTSAAPVRVTTGEARDLARIAVGAMLGPDGGPPAADVRPPAPTLAEWFADYEDRNPRRNEAETIRYHRHRFDTYVAPFRVEVGGVSVTMGTIPLDRIEGFHLDDLRDSILARLQADAGPAPRGRMPREAVGARTANLTLARLNTILLDAEARKRMPVGWVRPRPSELAQENGQDDTNHIRLHQAAAFYGAVRALRDRAGYKIGDNGTIADMILTCLWTGGRIGNVAAMAWVELDLVEGSWNIPREKFKTRRKMRGTHKRIPLTPMVVELLRTRQAASKGPWVFGASGDPRSYIHDISRSWAWVLEKAGISQRVTIHGLRHSLGTWLHQAGAPLKAIAAQLGQADLVSTQRYAHDEAAHVRGLTGGAIAASFTVVDDDPNQAAVRLTRDQWAEVLRALEGNPLAAAVSQALEVRRIG